MDFGLDFSIYRIIRTIGALHRRRGLEGWQESMVRIYGMNIPQEINDALTRKHLELKKHE